MPPIVVLPLPPDLSGGGSGGGGSFGGSSGGGSGSGRTSSGSDAYSELGRDPGKAKREERGEREDRLKEQCKDRYRASCYDSCSSNTRVCMRAYYDKTSYNEMPESEMKATVRRTCEKHCRNEVGLCEITCHLQADDHCDVWS
jgi:hypothetical protein